MSLTPNGSPVEAAGIEHIDGLYSYALVLTRNRSEAEDLLQETYVRALGAMGRLRTGSNVKSWLFTIIGTSGSISCGNSASHNSLQWMERRALWILQRLEKILIRST